MKLTGWQRAQLRWDKDPAAKARGGFWFTLIMWAVTFVASELLRPKPKLQNAKPAGLGDFNFPTATEGRTVPLLWGTVRIDGPNVVWYGDLRQDAITEKVKTGMFSSEQVTKGYEYKVGLQFGFCRGDTDTTMEGMWIGDTKVHSAQVTHGSTFTVDDPDLFGGPDLGNGGFLGTFKFYAGTPTQTADTYLSGFQDEGGDTPAYRGTAYICPETDPFYVGNSTSIKPLKFEVRRIPNGLVLGTGHDVINSADANPANMLFEIFTDTDWGLGYDPLEIDTAQWTTTAATLFTEGNGMSLLIDNALDASEVIRLIEQQIDGVVFYNQADGKWQIQLVRDDYTVAALDSIDETNSTLMNFSRGSWENTTNMVRTQYNDRNKEYTQTFAVAQDTANVRIQNDVNIVSTVNYPGVKDATLANSLAWRDLRSLSYPLAKVKVIVDRTFWDVFPAGVFRYNNDFLGIVDLAVRVQRIDYGDMENGKITLDLIQDVFFTAAPSFGNPGTTGWGDPNAGLAAIASDEQKAFEAPRALVRRNPLSGGLLSNRIFTAARNPGNAGLYEIRQRNASGGPSGDYAEDGIGNQFCKIGELKAALSTKSVYPLGTLDLSPTPDSAASQVGGFQEAAATNYELGVELVNLVMVDDEFMLVESVTTFSGDVRLTNVYRGVLDSVQADHAAGANVFILMSGAAISASDIIETNQVDVKLTPRNLGGALAEAAVTTISFTMDKRVRRPYPPSELTLNGVKWDAISVSLEGNGSGAEALYVTHDFDRRDYRVADSLNELDQLGVDANTLYTDFPAANSTDHDIVVIHDPTGTADAIDTSTVSGTNYQLTRIAILQALNGAVPTGDLRITLTASHTDDGDVLTSRQSLVHDYDITTSLTGQFEFGLLSIAETSALYTATVNGTYAFTLSSATSVGAIEYRLNGGAWTSLIAVGLTTGNIAGVVSTDTIEVRHQSNDASLLKQLDLNAPGAGQDGFMVLEN
tara:strand:- start:49923 stop:52859 length:2937 start_codon:yes stop_codon:yes gene_type:complete